MSIFDCRMIDVSPTSREPMRSFVDKLIQIERDDADVLSLSSCMASWPATWRKWAPRMLVVTNGKAEKGEALARELGLELFSRRAPIACRRSTSARRWHRRWRLRPGLW